VPSGSERRTKVLLFSIVFPNAAQPHHGIFVRERMRGLPEDVEVRVVAPAPWFPFISGLRPGFRPAIPAEEVQDGVPVFHPRFLSFPGILKCLDGLLLFLWTLPLLRRLHREHRLDVIDAHFTYPDGLAAVLAGKLLGIPVVLTERGTLPFLTRFRLRRPQLRFALRHAARVIAVSESLRQSAAEFIPAGRVRVIGNGTDPDVFRPIDRIEARRLLGLGKYGPLLVSVGTLAPRKGFHLVMEAVAKLRRRYPRIRFALVGGDGAEGAMSAELRQLAEKLGLGEQVIFAGPRKSRELALWYSAADVFVLATAHEGCPNVVVEALACGTPVVATPVGSIPELLADPGAGLLVEREVTAIAEGLDTALSRAWDRDRVRSGIASRTWKAVGREVAQEIRAALGLPMPVKEGEGGGAVPEVPVYAAQEVIR
jgi:teichuronic acid biosynthesis glycosyltransferase TuaC